MSGSRANKPPDLSAIGRGVALVEAKTSPDNLDAMEADAARRRYDAETMAILEANRDRRVNRKLRTKYADRVFRYLACYSLFVAALLFAQGFWQGAFFELPELVVVTLVGSTAAAAIGLVGFVVNGLFKNL